MNLKSERSEISFSANEVAILKQGGGAGGRGQEAEQEKGLLEEVMDQLYDRPRKVSTPLHLPPLSPTQRP
jgi:hypothetical protein